MLTIVSFRLGIATFLLSGLLHRARRSQPFRHFPGLTLGQDPTPHPQALTEAWHTRSAVATPLHATGSGSGQAAGICLVYLAVQDRSATATAPTQPAGYCSAVFGVEDLLGASGAGLDAEGLEFHLTEAARGAAPPIAQSAQGLESSAPVDVAGQRWVVTLRSTDRFLAAHSSGHAATILFTGLVIATLLSGYVRRALRQRYFVEQRVRVRTAQLFPFRVRCGERKRGRSGARDCRKAMVSKIFENSVEGYFPDNAGRALPSRCKPRLGANLRVWDARTTDRASGRHCRATLRSAWPARGVHRTSAEAWIRFRL